MTAFRSPGPYTARHLGGILQPAHPGCQGAGTSIAAEASNRYRGTRVICPIAGTISSFYIFVGTASGNVEGVILDDTATTRNRLWTSGSVAMSGTSAWQNLGNPGLKVYAGQHIDLVVGIDNATGTLARTLCGGTTNEGTLPTGFLPSPNGAAPILVWTFTAANFNGFASTFAESSMAATSTGAFVLAQVA